MWAIGLVKKNFVKQGPPSPDSTQCFCLTQLCMTQEFDNQVLAIYSDRRQSVDCHLSLLWLSQDDLPGIVGVTQWYKVHKMGMRVSPDVVLL